MNTPHNELSKHDLAWILQRTPEDILMEMKQRAGKLFLAGGFIRACIAHEEAADIDLFTTDRHTAKQVGQWLAGQGSRKMTPNANRSIHETDNAISIPRAVYGIPVQIIGRWTFDTPQQCMESFDFTIAKAAIWWGGPTEPGMGLFPEGWRSCCDPEFYRDLAAKRLIYTSPIRNEDAGGSMLRVLKFYQRGYRIPLSSLGAVMARMMVGVDKELLEKLPVIQGEDNLEGEFAICLTKLLREVDPAIDPKHLAHLPDVN